MKIKDFEDNPVDNVHMSIWSWLCLRKFQTVIEIIFIWFVFFLFMLCYCLQGYKCLTCKLVVHKKCHKLIKIQCGQQIVSTCKLVILFHIFLSSPNLNDNSFIACCFANNALIPTPYWGSWYKNTPSRGGPRPQAK